MPYKTKEEYNKNRRDRYQRRIEKAMEFLGGACCLCGEVEDLEFDHVVPSEKVCLVGDLARGEWKKLLKELEKCQLLCQECHIEKSKKEVPARHGTVWRYQHHKCKCQDCLDVGRKYYREAEKRRYWEKKCEQQSS